MGRRFLSLVAGLGGLVLLSGRSAEGQSVAVQVSAVQSRPIKGAVLSVSGNGSTSSPTDVAGKAQLILPQGTQPGDSIVLVLVRANPRNLMFFSPWHGLAVVPKPPGFIGVVLGARGDIKALDNSTVVVSFATALTWLNEQDTASESDWSMKYSTLSRLSGEVGFKPEQVDEAIRWGLVDTKDPDLRKIAVSYLAYYPEPLYKDRVYKDRMLAKKP